MAHELPLLEALDTYPPEDLFHLDGLDSQQLLRRILVEMQRTRRKLHEMLPQELDWATFPKEGGTLPFPAGLTTFELDRAQVQMADGRTIKMPATVEFYKRVQSMLIATDAPVTVTIYPSGEGKFLSNVNYIVHGVARDVRRLLLDATWPFLGLVVFATAPNPPIVFPTTLGMARYAEFTATDTVAWTSIPFIPATTGQTMLSMALGSATIPVVSVGQRMWIVRNIGPGNVEVRVQGTQFADNAALLDALDYRGWILDTDVHAPGGPNAASVAIAAGADAILESGLGLDFTRVQARLTSGVSGLLIIDMDGETYGIR